MESLTTTLVAAVALVGTVIAMLGAFAAAFGVDTRPGFDGGRIDR